ncbi:DNA recombination protein RmuC [Oceanimonas doudoroffii]|uniref:DNA recombination protein RmuC n=1 Tax=Oceanimonas doudoroffii TaxID=84158 RepID=A0A233RAG5_9GAMM|nr:DNA recombination protein RmuC [Oceanimonas doudoroffii]OXY80376.1 DNA recombination protein RmuC [Oceanimonas doudoroffii]
MTEWLPAYWPLALAALSGLAGWGLTRLAMGVRLQLAAQQAEHWQRGLEERQVELQDTRQRLEQQQQLVLKMNGRLKEYETLLRQERQWAAEKQAQFEASETRLQQQFENLAQRIFEQKTHNLRELNQTSLDALLGPLREQLEGFRRNMQETYADESRQRHSLKFEIERLAELHRQMSADTNALTRALKGDSKQQGNWGEVVLSRVLSESGLREGHEYSTQQSLSNADGKRYQPDVIVHLPQDKDIIIDAKVSLTAYERYFNGDTQAEREQALREHVTSVRGHIRELGRKDYHQLQGVRTLDYVLMFVAVEPAFLVAVEAEPGLVKYALDHNILLVSPTNLLVALRTIENLWRVERQNQNARRIAESAGKLYEKLRLFTEDMEAVGGSLRRADDSYQRAMKRLSQGRGNLVRQAEAFRELGVEVTKPLPEHLREQARLQDEDEPIRLNGSRPPE